MPPVWLNESEEKPRNSNLLIRKKKNRRIDDQSKLVKAIYDNLKKYNLKPEELDSKDYLFNANRDRSNIWYRISEDYNDTLKFFGPDDDFNEARRLMMAYRVNHPLRPYKTKVVELLEKVTKNWTYLK